MKHVRSLRPMRHVAMCLQWYSPLYHRGIVRYAREARWSVDVSTAHTGGISDIPIADADGLIGLFISRPALLDLALQRQIPVVDLSLILTDIPLPRVLPDNAGLGTGVAEHFISRGFRHFAFYRLHAGDWVGIERLDGFRKALKRHGLECHDLTLPPEFAKGGHDQRALDWIGAQLQALPRPLAVLAQKDDFAVEVLRACRNAGLDVPLDVAIMGCDNDELLCPYTPIPLSSADSDLEGQGYAAAQLLDRLMDGATPPRRPIRVPFKGVVVRQSSDVIAIAHRPLAAAMQLVCQRYADPALSVAQIAQSVGLTRSGLDKACREHRHRTVSQELKSVRLKHALELLRNSQAKIAAIARACGYSNAKRFRKIVLRATSLPPTRYRRKNRETE